MHLIDVTDSIGSDGIVKEAFKRYETIREELGRYGQGLTNKKEIVALNKIPRSPAIRN